MSSPDSTTDRRTVLKSLGATSASALTVSGVAVASEEPDYFCTTETACEFSEGPTYCCNRVPDSGALDSVEVKVILDESPSGSVGTLKVENDSSEFNCANISNYDYEKPLDSAVTSVYISNPQGQINVSLRVEDTADEYGNNPYGGRVEIEQCADR